MRGGGRGRLLEASGRKGAGRGVSIDYLMCGGVIRNLLVDSDRLKGRGRQPGDSLSVAHE